MSTSFFASCLSRRLVGAALLFLSTGVTPVSAEPPPSDPPLVIDDQSVAAAVSPSSAAVFFGVGREPMVYFSRLRVFHEAVTADADGVAVLSPEGGVAPLSVWAVVDLATGGFSIASPEGTPLRQIPFPQGALRRGSGGLLNMLEARFESAYALLVRPGVGAWTLALADAAASDLDGKHDGVVQVLVDNARPVGDSPEPPTEVRTGDIVVLVDADDLEFFSARL